MQIYQNYINGQFVDGYDKIEILNPATGQAFALQVIANSAQVNDAVQAARNSFMQSNFKNLRPVERGRMVQKMGEYLLSKEQEIAELLTKEAGKPLWESKLEVQGAARYFEYYGNQAETVEGKSIPLGADYYDFTVYEPYGVTAHIIPWNYPLEMTARSVSAALTTGNTCVIKTPELDPITNRYIALAAEHAGLPEGAVNLICGWGHEAGEALTSHPDVNQIVFTGSVDTGIRVASNAAKNIVPCVLELGGKSGAIVLPDADQTNLIDSVRWGIFFGAGQVCSAMSRLIVHESIHDDVLSQVVELAKKIKPGPGQDYPTFGDSMGPMISERQRDRAEGLCLNAVNEGARIQTGGHKLNNQGFFLEPTIISDVTPQMEIAQTEVFGPVLSVMRYSTEEEALSIINGTEYGLVGGVFTKDLNKAHRLSQKIRAGQVFINEWFAGGVETPFGGFGKSGYGREKGREALWNYVQTKNIASKLS
jgi:aldehyde dehydrogenase (NAD+)